MTDTLTTIKNPHPRPDTTHTIWKALEVHVWSGDYDPTPLGEPRGIVKDGLVLEVRTIYKRWGDIMPVKSASGGDVTPVDLVVEGALWDGRFWDTYGGAL